MTEQTQKWETVIKNSKDFVARFEVPGGWLYTAYDGGRFVGLAFVPDHRRANEIGCCGFDTD